MRLRLAAIILLLSADVAFAASRCTATSVGREYADTDCDGVKDVGEWFLDDDVAATASANDNDTSIATTAYVQTELTGYAGDTATFTNKTFNSESSGNVVTLSSIIQLRPATCQNVTATLNWDYATTNFPAATCVTGTNTQKAYAYFDDTTDECLQTTLHLPSDFSGLIDVEYIWLATPTTGAVGWCTQLACVSNLETDDPAFPAQASGNCISDTAHGTTLQMNSASQASISAIDCDASEQMHVRTCRDANGGAVTDSMTGDARLADVLLKIRRAQ